MQLSGLTCHHAWPNLSSAYKTCPHFCPRTRHSVCSPHTRTCPVGSHTPSLTTYSHASVLQTHPCPVSLSTRATPFSWPIPPRFQPLCHRRENSRNHAPGRSGRSLRSLHKLGVQHGSAQRCVPGVVFHLWSGPAARPTPRTLDEARTLGCGHQAHPGLHTCLSPCPQFIEDIKRCPVHSSPHAS